MAVFFHVFSHPFLALRHPTIGTRHSGGPEKADRSGQEESVEGTHRQILGDEIGEVVDFWGG